MGVSLPLALFVGLFARTEGSWGYTSPTLEPDFALPELRDPFHGPGSSTALASDLRDPALAGWRTSHARRFVIRLDPELRAPRDFSRPSPRLSRHETDLRTPFARPPTPRDVDLPAPGRPPSRGAPDLRAPFARPPTPREVDLRAPGRSPSRGETDLRAPFARPPSPGEARRSDPELLFPFVGRPAAPDAELRNPFAPVAGVRPEGPTIQRPR